jgi:hypothetical protein
MLVHGETATLFPVPANPLFQAARSISATQSMACCFVLNWPDDGVVAGEFTAQAATVTVV